MPGEAHPEIIETGETPALRVPRSAAPPGTRIGACVTARAPCTRLNGVADVTFLSQGPQFGIAISAHRPAMALNMGHTNECDAAGRPPCGRDGRATTALDMARAVTKSTVDTLAHAARSGSRLFQS